MHKTPETEGLSDEELVRRTLKSPEDYAMLISRYESKLSRYIARIGFFAPDEVEDIVQDTFIKTYEHLNDFDTSLKFSSWIYRIAHNETVSAIRKRGARPTQSAMDEEMIENIASNINHEEELHIKIQNEALRAAIGKLSEKYRDVLILKFLEDKSYEEISDILRIPTGTVGTLINRAKKQLATLMSA